MCMCKHAPLPLSVCSWLADTSTTPTVTVTVTDNFVVLIIVMIRCGLSA